MGAIAVLLSDDHAQAVAYQALFSEHAVVFELDAGTGGERVDAIVTDPRSLAANSAHIAVLRGNDALAAVPVLLFGDRRGSAALADRGWDLVDDVAFRPLEACALRARIEMLLRGREPSGEHATAARFQAAALPRALPRVPGLTMHAFYRPGTDERRAGGDWYDVLALGDGRALFSIGDVCGSGLDAAVAMAGLRQVFRGAAQINPDPAIVLDAAHRTLRDESPDRLVTAFIGVFDPVTALLTYASAGHPRPLLRGCDGSIVELATSDGAPLGLPFSVERSVSLAAMPPGSLLVLYTDGLTDATRDPVAGEAGVRRAIASARVRAAPNVALAIHEAVIAAPAPDDIAILTIAHVERDAGGERLSHWSFDVRDYGAARDVRAQIVALLRRLELNDAQIADAELVFAELIGNVIRYAARRVDVTLDASGDAPVLHVLDGGPGFGYLPRLPANVLSERGRGLFIVAQLTADFNVTRRPHGGSHARAVLSRT